MSVQFGNGLDLNNGLASRLLRAIGYNVSESSAGYMPLNQALTGVQEAKSTVSKDDLEYLMLLEEEILQLKEEGATVLDWF